MDNASGQTTTERALSLFCNPSDGDVADIDEKVNTFLVSLPFGSSVQDALIETRVGDCLAQVLREKAAAELKVEEW